jgi:hypothetical protein
VIIEQLKPKILGLATFNPENPLPRQTRLDAMIHVSKFLCGTSRIVSESDYCNNWRFSSAMANIPRSQTVMETFLLRKSLTRQLSNQESDEPEVKYSKSDGAILSLFSAISATEPAKISEIQERILETPIAPPATNRS